ncbi:retinal guanylyl cyclase 2 [Anthonomus grandis grandis]|uniref:retinal guanylyl cyclase 2 n=1 Tax=Anthonomus grandis grandis TaxID=2921223 RepID=UPI002165CBD2|nr:retinal guanylyl cyclase 2 [Anthonomus grandis grandis]
MAGLYLIGLLACVVPSGLSHPEPLLVLTDMCYYPINMTYIEGELAATNISVTMLRDPDICENHQRLLQQVVSSAKTRSALGSFHPEVCQPGRRLCEYFNATFRPWNCPTLFHDNDSLEPSPSIPEIASGFARVVADMKWKSVAIITLASGWWPSLSQTLELELRDLGIIPKHLFLFDKGASQRYIERKLRVLKKWPCRALIFCLPPTESGLAIFHTARHLNLSQDNTLSIFLDILTLPSWKSVFNATTTTTDSLNKTGKNYLNETHQDVLLFLDNVTLTIRRPEDLIVKLTRDSFGFRTFFRCFVLVDVFTDERLLRPLMRALETNWSSIGFETETVPESFEDWWLSHKQLDECDAFCKFSSDNLFSAWVYWVISCSVFVVFMIIAAVAAVRFHLLKQRANKAPYKVLLAATDFTFPSLAENLGVDEGIEAMLCCWLQQLQEFGGPEVEKPDLLQNSGAASARRTPLRTGSSPNLTAKQVIVDPRVRYNGDLVQMKPVPSNGSVELKAKAIEFLVLLHGLRHENLNPLIGVLAEPPRAALVSEYCARGSLQDVLQQDDIKLDWSFRLSLLTDLVRGMRYLHSTQIKVHGYLSSRNCVIDARWVLKVTDYGLPSFYEAQGIQSPEKSARELLWTAPELLRYSNLRKTGTQPGDVYSFGIILQEVVVRGEPFCMLAFTPEEIIEKIKHPPPLIRPSVSKGAAPPEAINIMRQCWAEQAEMRPDFNAVHDQFKKLNHGRKVNIVDTMFQMLEKYSNNLEELIRERTEQLDIEKKKTEQLLNRMLPSYVAEKLKLGMPVDPEEYGEVTIYFSDIVGFTTISAHSTPFQVVDLLNDLYTCFDATINAYNVYKVETIGDAYMVVGGLPVRIPDHAEQIATMALDLLHESGKFRIRHLPGTPLRLRIGLHTGPCCAGVVGLTMPRYCLFGDTVNTASRMESTGAAWRIHMSEATKSRLEKAGGYHIEYRGPTEIKGKGTMDTYWLLGKEGFNKELPVPPPLELDEKLVISNHSTIPSLKEDSSLGDSVSLESCTRHMSISEGPSKATSPNPTFIKTMEYSRFATLSRMSNDEKTSDRIVKSTSSDMPLILGTPVSASEVAAALLGSSTNSLCPYRRGPRSTSKIKEEEEDISTPYSHYKCLSPKLRTGKLLRRQFSLDRAEDVQKVVTETSPRLCKQNSAGAADLEKIEEIPLKIPSVTPSISSQIHSAHSVSADSLIR